MFCYTFFYCLQYFLPFEIMLYSYKLNMYLCDNLVFQKQFSSLFQNMIWYFVKFFVCLLVQTLMNLSIDERCRKNNLSTSMIALSQKMALHTLPRRHLHQSRLLMLMEVPLVMSPSKYNLGKLITSSSFPNAGSVLSMFSALTS
ncbi:hypothetical protein ZEAMMB73_Zm00001d054111 [Zea mays]|uniref:Uncharacterized protein n=1 Tax=Zea mays TaxID=4577 RepID=A0A1D6QVK1_MAIZE|nr:hypothetical protein ZEAMMB73_Zm00001d054111 [Zea mays]AQK61358.1 hypothetical protein ZEAMMB73_Zm00001d054111 [Zea mays]